jgi:hypothetical protein
LTLVRRGLRTLDQRKGGAFPVKEKKDPGKRHTSGSSTRTLKHRRLRQGPEKRWNACNFEAGVLVSLYKIAQCKLAVDKRDNFAEAILNRTTGLVLLLYRCLRTLCRKATATSGFLG